MFHQGDICKVNLNPVAGHEQGNYRPVMIVSRDDVPLPGGLQIVIPITSHRHGFALEFDLPEGMATTGYALPFHVRSLDLQKRHANFIEHAPANFIEKCCSITGQLFDTDRDV